MMCVPPWNTASCSTSVAPLPNIDHVTITMWAHGEREVTIQSDGTFATDYDTTGWEPFDGGEVYVRLDGYSSGEYYPDSKVFSIVAAAVPDAPYTITDDSTGGDCQYIGT